MCKSIAYERFDIALLLWGRCCLTLVEKPQKVIDALLGQIDESLRLFEYKAFLFDKLVSFMSMQELERALRVLHRSFINQGGTELLETNLNPMKCVMLALLMLQQITSYSSVLVMRAKVITESLEAIASSFLDNANGPKELKQQLLQKDITGRSALDYFE